MLPMQSCFMRGRIHWRAIADDDFSHGRAFAAARTPHLPLVQAFPLCAALPFVRTGRIVRHAWRHRELRGVTLRLVPAILLAESLLVGGRADRLRDIRGRVTLQRSIRESAADARIFQRLGCHRFAWATWIARRPSSPRARRPLCGLPRAAATKSANCSRKVWITVLCQPLSFSRTIAFG